MPQDNLKITRFAIKLGFTFAKVIDRMPVIHAALDLNFEIFIVRDQLHVRAFVAHLLLENLELAHAHALLSHFDAKKEMKSRRRRKVEIPAVAISLAGSFAVRTLRSCHVDNSTVVELLESDDQWDDNEISLK